MNKTRAPANFHGQGRASCASVAPERPWSTASPYGVNNRAHQFERRLKEGRPSAGAISCTSPNFMRREPSSSKTATAPGLMR
ncbi:MAG: hypothetical protein ACJAZN_001213 [Planctomycetota bacterium]|jgi:hypothetical protein